MMSKTTQVVNTQVSGSGNICGMRCECTKCTYCQNLLGAVSIKCGECVNFHLCLKCFSMSAEIGEHKKDHNYLLKSSINFPIFDNEKLWTYKEELLLLQLIEQYGFGNWEEVAKHIPNRTVEECMQHYHSYYIYGNLGKYTFNGSQKSGNVLNGCVMDQACELASGESTSSEMSTTVLLPPIEMSPEEQRAFGYMPLRDDFEREYKNDAETLISNLIIANNQVGLLSAHSDLPISASLVSSTSSSYENDDAIDIDLKLTLIQMYRECLIERQRFKKIAREYGLINNATGLMNKQSVGKGGGGSGVGGDRRRKCNTDDKEMSELNDRLRKYAQFMSVSDYETLLENLRKQRQLCKRIQELQFYRNKLGLTKFKEVEKYKEEEKQAKLESDEMTKTPRKRRKSSIKSTTLTSTNEITPLSAKRVTRRSQKQQQQFLLEQQQQQISMLNEDSNASIATSTRSRTTSLNSANLEETIVKEMSELITEEDEGVMSEHREAEEEEEEASNMDVTNLVEMCEDEETASAGSTAEDYGEDLSSGMASSGGSGVNEIAHDEETRKYRKRGQSKSSTPKPVLKRSPIKSIKDKKLNSPVGKKIKNKGLSKSFSTSRNGRSERLCSMPGYNLLSENEKKLISSLQLKPNDYINYKTNLIKNSLIRRKQKPRGASNHHQAMSNSFSSNSSSSSTNTPSVSPSTTTSSLNASMILRRHNSNTHQLQHPSSLNQTITTFISTACDENNAYLTSPAANNTILSQSIHHTPTTTTTTTNTNSNTTISLTAGCENNTILGKLMKSSCPGYFQIPRTTRKRILRFLCDNGWIDVSS